MAIRSFDDYISAHIIMGRLKDEDIVCHLQDEYTTTTAPFLTNLSAGIKLMVPEPQVERALEILTRLDQDTSS